MRLNPLLDTTFLDKLFLSHSREIFIRVVALNTNEESVEEIQGRAQAGSTLNIDGTSSMRRSCTLTLVAEELNIHEYYWGLQTKFKLYVGLANNIDSRYDDVIWFPMGLFLITKFNTSQGTAQYTVQIQGKDKMALLNGDISGVITALSVDFGTIDYIADDGSVENKKLPLKEVIKEAVHEYAKEPYHNIIINDMDDLAVELLSYRGETPLYLLLGEDDVVCGAYLDGDVLVTRYSDNAQVKVSDEEEVVYNSLNHLGVNELLPATQFIDTQTKKIFTIAKYERGESVGYRPTDLVFAGDLISQVGSTVTSMLDKIKNMLGQYEYFYSIEGQFVFQRKKNYKMKSWLPEIVDKLNDDVYIENAAYASASTYSFQDSYLVSQFANNPDFSNIKNDFTVWGKRKSINGAEIPVHARYAIDKRPYEYTTIEVTQQEADRYQRIFEFPDPIPAQKSVRYVSDCYYTKNDALGDAKLVDWREVMYRMALDYRKWMHLDGFNAKLELANKRKADQSYHPSYQGYLRGYTGYELYYTDLEGFWRTLYDPAAMESSALVTSEPYITHYVSKYEFDKLKEEASSYYITEPCIAAELYDAENTYVQIINGKLVEIDTIPTGLKISREQNPDLITIREIGRGDTPEDGITYYRKSGSSTFIIVQLTGDILANVSSSTKYYYFTPLTDDELIYSFSKKYFKIVDEKPVIVPFEDIIFESIGTNGSNDLGIATDIVSKRNLTTITHPEQYLKKIKFIFTINDVPYYNEAGEEVGGETVQNEANKDIELYKIVPIEQTTALYENYLNTLNSIENQYNTEKAKLDSKGSNYRTQLAALQEARDTATETAKTTFSEQIEGYEYVYNPNMEYFTRDVYGTFRRKDYVAVVLRDGGEMPESKFNIGLQNGETEENSQYIIASPNNLFAVQQVKINHPYETSVQYYVKNNFSDYNSDGWIKEKDESPQTLTFWFDFLDTDGELAKYSVPRLGSRPKAENNDQIKAIYYREIPNVIFAKDQEEVEREKKYRNGYSYIVLGENDVYENLFSISTQGRSAIDAIGSLLYQHTNAAEQCQISAIPVYTLQPNTRIILYDRNSNIDGEYDILRISLPLNYTGMMTITAAKAIDNIL